MKKVILAAAVSAVFAVPAVAAENADVVVVGAGGAGLSAAVTLMIWAKKSSFLKKWLSSAATQTAQPAV